MSSYDYLRQLFAYHEPPKPNLAMIQNEVGPHAATLAEKRWKHKVWSAKNAVEWQRRAAAMANSRGYGG